MHCTSSYLLILVLPQSKYYVFIGYPGSGKATLFSNCSLRERKKNPIRFSEFHLISETRMETTAELKMLYD